MIFLPRFFKNYLVYLIILFAVNYLNYIAQFDNKYIYLAEYENRHLI